MQRILLSHVPEAVAQWVRLRLAGLEVVAREGAVETAAALALGHWDLVLLQHHSGPPATLELLRAFRSQSKNEDVPVLYVLDAALSPVLMSELVEQMQVTRILVHPLDPEALLGEISGILRLATIKDAGESQAAVNALWHKFLPSTLERIKHLEGAGVALMEGTFSQEQRLAASSDAHKLAGSLGTFGFPRGSVLATRLEQLLERHTPESDIPQFAELVVQLREVVAGVPGNRGAHAGAAGRYVLLLDAPGEPLQVPLKNRDFELVRVEHPGPARTRLSDSRPAAILVNLGVPEESKERLAFLRSAAQGQPDLALIALLPQANLEDWVEAMRHGARCLLDSGISSRQLSDALETILERQVAKVPRILVLDGDPASQRKLSEHLLLAGMRVELLASPITLLETLQQFQPHLMLAALELPFMSGLEVCRLLRMLPRWQALPIVLMTEGQESRTVVQVFASGADDFVARPIVGPELVARISNRLMRNRLVGDLGASDPVTGLPTWITARPRLRSYFDLARRVSQSICVAVLELDGFPQLPHLAADRSMADLAHRLTSSFRGEDTVSRYEGSRLLVALYGAREADGIERISRLLGSFSQKTQQTFSAGVALYSGNAQSLEEILRQAERALESAQSAGPGQIVAGSGRYLIADRSKSRVDVGLVQDDPLLGPLILHVLKNKGYSTFWIRDGVEASDQLVAAKPELSARVLLLGVDLPGLSGHNLLREMKEHDILNDTKVILLTSRSTPADILEGLELGAAAYVTKPFSLPVMLEKVRLALGS